MATSKPRDKHTDELLDAALEESFPASDPIAVTVHKRSDSESKEDEEHTDELLDEALEESFPASDPVSIPDKNTE